MHSLLDGGLPTPITKVSSWSMIVFLSPAILQFFPSHTFFSQPLSNFSPDFLFYAVWRCFQHILTPFQDVLTHQHPSSLSFFKKNSTFSNPPAPPSFSFNPPAHISVTSL